tara:strand:+ start:81 stop:512 length:432 start_codon:yes stop_codon:yes gene_type:complete
MIKTFRGNLASSGSERIRLSTNNGLTGYRIVKFQIFPATPGASSYENVVQVYTEEPDGATGTVTFDNPLLIAAAYLEGNNANNATDKLQVVFDHVKFNQDIYITNYDVDGDTESINYYIELEQMDLTLNEATVATLKDMRGRQ